jgi:hypothetical protein
MGATEGVQQLKNFIDENPHNFTDEDLARLREIYERMKEKYNV